MLGHSKPRPTSSTHFLLTWSFYPHSHYCKIFRTGAFGQANGQIPMVNMLDDHDLYVNVSRASLK